MYKRIGVVGGGVMGKGIVRHFLTKDLPVTLIEANPELAEKARQDVQRAYESAIKAGKLETERSEKWLGALITSSEISILRDCDLVIETVPEDLQLKKTVLASIERSTPHEATISSNTSALPIGVLSASLASPWRFVGTHFFNPSHVMPLVEVAPSTDTAPETLQRVTNFLADTGKRPVVVKDCPGFLVNRILGAYINEALRLLEREAGIIDLDKAVEALGFPMGPVKLGDMAGWDVICAANRTLAMSYGERFALPHLLIQLDSEGRFGAKTGKGLMDHTARPAVPTEDLVPATREPDIETIKQVSERITYAIIAEALRCLDEGVASAADIDKAMTLGAGLPRGPLAWVEEIGREKVLSDMESLSGRHGARFWPAPVLRICALAGRPVAAGRG
jgi:3-hydroxyacyl-CoA dehydrogenase / enoyl-CoA hydratase / 3-hydroxybutyryl-CoA epimerase